MLQESRFAEHPQLLLLQGIAMGGFNVIDVGQLSDTLCLPVLVVARYKPNLNAIRDALLNHVRGGKRKWRLIEKLGPMESLAGVYVQRVGISVDEADATIRSFAINSNIPEPLRVAHLIAGGIVSGASRGAV